ncbi:MAG: hypothetical protein GY727_16385 [Gammaproteobacteria bacterium]|nr:hypothetical protein [Gammaproteobacteria bacterium]MCP4089218.1 hypothetical protein [Gammaproteobacteria bacterium]MCP4276758.1 hypothetical protein [Gammaproteobacteria bacterium]MCP4830601.1 hypothetical protein [Gammaproteobacteria bacterium]MCP4928410.1 hypothetical protein [Gammaproteobacteria bacterium]
MRLRKTGRSLLDKYFVELLFSKPLSRNRVLFSTNNDWATPIKRNIDFIKYFPVFESFEHAHLDQYSLVIPLSLPDTYYLNKNHAELNGEKFLIPSNRAIDICKDKVAFNNYLCDTGYQNYIPNISGEQKFPYVLKKRVSEFGENIFYIKNASDEHKYQSKLSSDEYFKQAYIGGRKEYTTHILIKNKKIIFQKTLEFDFNDEFYIKGKYYKRMSWKKLETPPFINDFLLILNNLDYEGICCFNYKIHDKQIKLFEINPRYGGSLTQFLKELMVAYAESMNSDRIK